MLNGRLLALLVALATPGVACAGEVDLPAGWRAPTAAQNVRNLAEARKSGGAVNQKLSIAADFDGDGRQDRAVVLLNDRTGRFAVFVRRASAGRFVKVADGGDAEWLWNYTLELASPGEQQTACGRGHNIEGPCRPTVSNRWPGIFWVTVESHVDLIYWDGRRFRLEVLSD